MHSMLARALVPAVVAVAILDLGDSNPGRMNLWLLISPSG